MDLQTFLTLSGLTLTEKQENDFARVSRRAELRLTRLLGWSASQRNLFEEVGKTKAQCSCLNQLMNEDQYDAFIEALEDPDEEEGIIRLFPYDSSATNLFIDPATAIYKVKLVQFARGSDQQFVTIKTFRHWNPKYEHNATVDDSARTYAHYIELCKDDILSPCKPCGGCTNCAFLAVDADWVRGTYPDDLVDLLMELIVQEYQKPFSLNADQNRLVQSESVNNHSVTYVVTEEQKKGIGTGTGIQNEDWFLDEIKRWIGPYSPLYVPPRVY